ncbi:sugar phosphate isomerase/epimerase family protein [Demequina gelatinilytica]|uniref:sugar phosphate isomerase/epimerase family protein n=1 Tax=Demequina gelatinilytica TaxID=1638980 RepID=UPI0009E3E796|nr:sugar phosphate isomerase/epimerase [Demequina gelatinilytica]
MSLRRALVLVAAALLTGCTQSAPAEPDATAAGASSIPDSRISVQLFTFFYAIGFGEDQAARDRQEQVLASLAEAGYRYVEPVDYTGFQGLDATEYRALLDAYGLQVSSLHTSVTMGTSDQQWEAKLDTATTLGTAYVGAGENPRTFTSSADWVAFAEKIDHLGEMAADRGMRYLVHLHDYEFTSVYGGESAFDILVEHTSPENVTFELDLYWATAAGEDARALVSEHRDRIALLHVKDMAEDGGITTVGEGVIDFPSIFEAAGPGIDFYVIERDPEDAPSFDPLGPSVAGLAYLRSVRW